MLESLLLIFLILYMAYRNGLIAKLKGKNQVLWSLLTLVSYWICSGIGALVVMIILIRSHQITQADIERVSGSQKAVNDLIMPLMLDNPIHFITIMVFGLGGYLLVRFILERMPIKNMPKDHEGVV